MGQWQAVSLLPAVDAPPLAALVAGHSGALCDAPSWPWWRVTVGPFVTHLCDTLQKPPAWLRPCSV